MIGLDEDEVIANVVTSVNTGSGNPAYTGIGLDSTSARAAGSQWSRVDAFATLTASYRGRPGIGSHFLAWLEQSSAGGATFLGDNGGGVTEVQSRISGTVRA